MNNSRLFRFKQSEIFLVQESSIDRNLLCVISCKRCRNELRFNQRYRPGGPCQGGDLLDGLGFKRGLCHEASKAIVELSNLKTN